MNSPPPSHSAAADPGGAGGALADLGGLAAACARGERAAFERLHTRFARGIQAFFAKRAAGNPELADELAQRAWAGVWASLSRGSYDPERAAISTFLYAVAGKTWLQHLRERRRGGANADGVEGELELLEVEFGSGDDPAAVAGAAERLDAVREYLRKREFEGALTEDEHAIIVAAAGGATDRELAARLLMAPSTVNAKKQSGWGKLRRHLAKLGHRVEEPERGGGGRE